MPLLASIDRAATHISTVYIRACQWHHGLLILGPGTYGSRGIFLRLDTRRTWHWIESPWLIPSELGVSLGAIVSPAKVKCSDAILTRLKPAITRNTFCICWDGFILIQQSSSPYIYWQFISKRESAWWLCMASSSCPLTVSFTKNVIANKEPSRRVSTCPMHKGTLR